MWHCSVLPRAALMIAAQVLFLVSAVSLAAEVVPLGPVDIRARFRVSSGRVAELPAPPDVFVTGTNVVLSDDGGTIASETDGSSSNPCGAPGQIQLITRAASYCASIRRDVSAQVGNAPSTSPALSGDGTTVAFVSKASNLEDACANGVSHVFRSTPIMPGLEIGVGAPRGTGRPGPECVSVGRNGAPGNADSLSPGVDRQGEKVVFSSVATNLVADGCTSGVSQVFLAQVVLAQVVPSTPPAAFVLTTCLSVDANGNPGNADSRSPKISGSGRFIVFESNATNLSPACTTGITQVFRRDLFTGAITCASVSQEGQPGNGPSTAPVISEGGEVLAFVSSATNLVPNSCSTGVPQIFVRTISTIRCVSVDASGVAANQASGEPALSGNGQVVAFTSSADNLLAFSSAGLRATPPSVQTGGSLQVFRSDLIRDRVRLLSQRGGQVGNGASRRPAVDRRGGRIAFQTSAPNLRAPRRDNRAANQPTAPDLSPGEIEQQQQEEDIVLDVNVETIPGAVGTPLLRLPEPAEAAPLIAGLAFPPSDVVVDFTPVPGAFQYGVEISGLNTKFANPNGTFPDSTNGFGGRGFGFVTGVTRFAIQFLDLEVHPFGSFLQMRVVALSENFDVIGPFSDAATLVVTRTYSSSTSTEPDLENKVIITAPISGTRAPRGSLVTFQWTPFTILNLTLFGPEVRPGVFFGLEFTGPNASFSNPNGLTVDPLSGLGGPGGALIVPPDPTGRPIRAPELTVRIPDGITPGVYEVRVIPLDSFVFFVRGGELLIIAPFSDSVSIVVD
jgi:hypothetical protein